MAQTNYTPISLYYSTTASAVPTAANLVQGELAINTNDGKLYYEDSSGVVQVLATKSTGSIGGSNTQVQFNNSGSLGGSSGLTWDGSFLTTSSIKNSALTSGRVTYAGASGLLSDSANLQFTGSVLGVGVTPSTWFSDYRVLQLGSGASLSGRNGSSEYMQLMANAYRDASADYRYIGSDPTTQYLQSGGIHVWYNAPSGTAGNVISFLERMRITSTGLVGIGTSSPNYTLQLNSGASSSTYLQITHADAGTGASDGLQIGLATGSSPDAYIAQKENAPLIFQTNSTERMRISATGIVTMSAYGAGAATFDASGVISSVSDETWKIKDGVPTNTDAMLQKLEPGYWFYNDEKKETFGSDRQLGFYAQNVHEAIGEEAAPTPEEGKPWGYYDRSVLAVAVMSLKNALNTIEELKQRITVLENK